MHNGLTHRAIRLGPPIAPTGTKLDLVCSDTGSADLVIKTMRRRQDEIRRNKRPGAKALAGNLKPSNGLPSTYRIAAGQPRKRRISGHRAPCDAKQKDKKQAKPPHKQPHHVSPFDTEPKRRNWGRNGATSGSAPPAHACPAP